MFRLGKLDRGKARGVRRVGQGPKKLPPAPTHRPIRPVLPATPLGSNFNNLLMGGRQLDFDRVDRVFPIGGLSTVCDCCVPVSDFAQAWTMSACTGEIDN